MGLVEDVRRAMFAEFAQYLGERGRSDELAVVRQPEEESL